MGLERCKAVWSLPAVRYYIKFFSTRGTSNLNPWFFFILKVKIKLNLLK